MEKNNGVPPTYSSTEASASQQQEGYVATGPPVVTDQQPSTQQPMGFQASGEVQPVYNQGSNVKSQEWQAGLCNCCPVSSCLLSFFLPCLSKSFCPFIVTMLDMNFWKRDRKEDRDEHKNGEKKNPMAKHKMAKKRKKKNDRPYYM